MAFALTSCANPNTLAVFSDPQSEVDILPTGASPNVITTIDQTSTRLLWVDAGVSYFAARSEKRGVCLIILDKLEAADTCSHTLPIHRKIGDAPTMMMADTYSDNLEEYIKVAEHLWASRSPH
ncbi:hypothetical protein [Cryobacterium sp. Y82]|uniref:hypothetical protein n=1 Tax=Cryobacterium sp. Y82 TaxID=2045017 RepID=UPI000CE34A3D|nr:hypothetical protein [Cryobacterium sp. Y82]